MQSVSPICSCEMHMALHFTGKHFTESGRAETAERLEGAVAAKQQD